MKTIADDYLSGVSQATISNITKTLKNEKYTALEILLIHPYTFIISKPAV